MNYKTTLLSATLAITAGFASFTTFAQEDYPNQPVRIVVPFAAGGGGDFVTRAWSDKMSEALGQPMLVENRPGGNTINGTDVVAQATPDGHTLLVVNPNIVTNNFTGSTPYDSEADFDPVSLFVTYPMGLAVRADLEVDSVEELIAYAQENPGDLNYASSGDGSTSHLATLLLLDQTETEMQHIPYGGAGPAIADVAAGTIDFFFTGLSQTMPHVESGRVKLLAVTSLERLETYPNVPTVHESGVEGFEALVWWGLVAPSGTPRERIDTIQTTLAEVMTDPVVQQRYVVLDGDTSVSTPKEFHDFIAAETTKWGRIIGDSGLGQ